MHTALAGTLSKNPTSSLDSESHAGLMAHPGRLRRSASLRLLSLCRSEPFPLLGCQTQVRTETTVSSPFPSVVKCSLPKPREAPSHASRWVLQQSGTCPRMSLVRINFALQLLIFP